MSYSTYETDSPWVVYHYGLTHDGWWPFWNSTRILGRAKIAAECAICGVREVLAMKIPRFGPVEDKGKHPKRLEFLAAHAHPDKPGVEHWARPLLVPHVGVNLDAIGKRIVREITALEDEILACPAENYHVKEPPV